MTTPGLRRLIDGREAPELWVRYRCPRCAVVEVADAYRGPPTHSCAAPPPLMAPVELVDEADLPES